ncbi:Glutaredoxin [Mactra antiquata]
MGDVKQMVDRKIKEKKVMVFSKSYCPYCTKAKKALKVYVDDGTLKEEDYDVMEIENNKDCDAIQRHLKTLTGATSVPRVFINGKCIGGGDETAAAHSNGALKKMLLQVKQ